MAPIIKKIGIKKTLYLKNNKSSRVAFKTSTTTKTERLLGLLRTPAAGVRKVKKVKAIKGGSSLYNTALRDVDTVEHLWKENTLLFLRKKGKSTANKAGGIPTKRNWLNVLNKTAVEFETSVQNAWVAKTNASFKNNTPLLSILQNKLMHDGRKGPAEKIFFKTLVELNRYTKGGTGYKLFYVALESLKPTLITVVRRVGRNYYHVPVPLHGPRQYKLAFQWLLEVARKNPRAPIHKSLADEIITIVSSSSSEALKKKELMYRSVITNRAYSHYRWV
jgi:small subunit ribosomal protein S7